ncbi:CRZ2 [Candida jiufengensis]|uniref:CRZ2 n=1 Tax=Candida jiufengensis TaxID=497108 RepID=UPI0022248379|nr:CRZ2 [Candida jiufengensis]KAI5954589.1 CRZ2 [Candida jiufengensis]
MLKMEQISIPSSVVSTSTSAQSQYPYYNYSNLSYNLTQDYKIPTQPQQQQQQYNFQPTGNYFVQPQQSQSLPSIFASHTHQQVQDSTMLYSNSYNMGNNNNNQQFEYTQHNNPYLQQQQPSSYSSSNYPILNNNNNYHTQNTGNSDHRYPLSPASISEKSSSVSSVSSTNSSHYNYTQPTTYLQPHQHHHHHPQSPPSTTNIDYSSLVSYTISPSLKRKRRKRKDLTTSHSTTSSSAASASNLDDISESFPCTLCDKVFQKPYNLKSHMKTHSTDKPFSCSYCTKTFARSHDKKRHEVLHQGIKNFKCEGYLQDGITKWGCGKKFARSDALSRHFRTETGWLCIKPLMDEAKKLEESNNVGIATQGQNNNETSNGFNMLPNSIDFKSLGNEEFYDNSKFIRKLIHSK